MGRSHPKFLYQHVQDNTPSDGEYVMHLQEPLTLFFVAHSRSGAVTLHVAEGFNDGPDVEPIKARATKWYIATKLGK